MELTNRELAALIWSAIVLVLLLFNKPVRASIKGLLAAFFRRQILDVLGLMLLWVTASVALLVRLGIWSVANLKTTLLWFVTFAFVVLFRVAKAGNSRALYKDAVIDVIGITALLTFIVNVYTFSLLVELILVPLTVLAALLQAVAGNKPEYSATKKFLTGVITLVGLSYFGYAVYEVFYNPSSFFTLGTLREFSNPILLSLMLFPFIYLIGVYVKFESALIRLQWALEDSHLRRFAKWQSLQFGFNTALLDRWIRRLMLSRPTKKAEVSKSVSDLKKLVRREKHPPHIDPSQGWCPYISKEFLKSEGFVSNEYEDFSGEFSSRSNDLRVGEGPLSNSLSYDVEGDCEAARRLILRLDVTNLESESEAVLRFERAAHILLVAATGGDAIDERFAEAENFNVIRDGYTFIFERDQWSASEGLYSLTFTIQR